MTQVRLGVYEKALPESLAWPNRLELARRLGFSFLELSVDESDRRIDRLSTHSEERKRIREAMKATAFPIQSLCLSAHRRYALGSEDAGTRARAHDLLKRAVDLAYDLGIRTVQLAGYYVYYEAETPDAALRYEHGVARGADVAAAAGVMLGIENMDTVGLASLADGVRLLDRIGSPWLQLYPDVGNLTERGRDPLEEITAARGRMVALHLKDAKPGAPRRVPFGEGEVPFAPVLECVREGGFSGPMLVEMWNDDAPDSMDRLAAARAWVAARLREAGFAVPEVTI